MSSVCGDIRNICINDKGKISTEPQVTYGYAPTLVAEFHGNLPKVICIDDTQGFDGVRYYQDYFPTLRSQRSELKVACVAMRGRYDENGKVEQHLEPRFDGVTNTITTVSKDNMVLEQNKKS